MGSAWIAVSANASGLSPRSTPGSASATAPAHGSTGCSLHNARVRKWRAHIRTPPGCHNHCAEVLAAWALLPAAALLRAFGPDILPGLLPYAAAGALWIIAFGLFLVAHGPMLLRPRADGKPG